MKSWYIGILMRILGVTIDSWVLVAGVSTQENPDLDRFGVSKMGCTA